MTSGRRTGTGGEATSIDGDCAAPRYLRYNAPQFLAGLDHHVGNLACLLREAHASRRLALLPPLTLHPKHNFDHSRDWRWNDYYDLDASTLIDGAGREHPLPIAKNAPGPPSCPSENAKPFLVRPGKHIPPESQRHRLVVRRIGNSVFRRQVPQEHPPAVRLELRPAPPVARLAARATASMASLGDEGFVGIHVRRGDRLGEYPAACTEPAGIKARLASLAVARGTVLFIASDERDPRFFEPLRVHYQLVRYTDFPFLEALVSGEHPDNYLLYRVEQEILARAELRIETLPNRGPHAHAALVDAAQWRRSSPGLWERGRKSLHRLYARFPFWRDLHK